VVVLVDAGFLQEGPLLGDDDLGLEPGELLVEGGLLLGRHRQFGLQCGARLRRVLFQRCRRLAFLGVDLLALGADLRI
jgi:hypothetical protein